MKTVVVCGTAIAAYGFPGGHPFGPDRHDAFLQEFRRRGLPQAVTQAEPVMATPEQLAWFHTPSYIEKVRRLSELGHGLLDFGDTPAFKGVYEAAAAVVGSALLLVQEILNKRAANGFLPIGGLHHARRDSASGFCVFNDCGVVIEYLLAQNFNRVAYVDIDAHHGDGVFYAFESDPRLIFADIHQSGIYPGTGDEDETGKGTATGYKLNIPLSYGANDNDFRFHWPRVLSFLREKKPEFILLQCGADSIAGDPITGMAFSPEVHRQAARDLAQLAAEVCAGRLIAFGGGGYNRRNLALAWNHVVEELVQAALFRNSKN